VEFGELSLQQIQEDQTLEFTAQKISVTIMTLVHISDIMAKIKDRIWYGVKIVSALLIYNEVLCRLFNF